MCAWTCLYLYLFHRSRNSAWYLVPTYACSCNLLIWLCWVFVVVHRLFFSCSVCGLSSCGVWPLEHLGSVAVAPGPSYCVACGILVSRPGIEPTSPAFGSWVLSHWTTREVPVCLFLRASREACYDLKQNQPQGCCTCFSFCICPPKPLSF